ncbi:MAG TPA: helix-turn-helix domain-containing protein [Nitrospiraceae bacterium]|nr:helix-turn-helix domain-containing protein [Nitrospiraceae bacterium]
MPDKDHTPDENKREALRQHGTLNPRPRDVTHPLFRGSEFFDSRDLLQVKYEMLREVQVENKPVSQSAAVFGFSRPSFYQAQTAFARDGLSGLIPRKRGPRGAHKLTPEVMAFVAEARHAEPSPGVAELARRIEERFGVRVHPRSIERRLRKKKPR